MMTRFLPAGMWTLGLACAVALGGSCSDDETNPVTSASSSSSTGTGTGGAGGMPGVTVPGLTGPVQGVYDASGVLHIRGKADDDCFAALGYFHAANRFFFMDFIRNLVRGSLASLVKAGDVVLSQDYQNRLFFTTRDGDPLEKALYDKASPATRGHLDAYTRGVNAWIADMRAGKNEATLTTEYDFSLIVKSAIRDWEPEDSAAVGLYVLNDLSNSADEEMQLGIDVPAFDPALAADVFAPEPVFDAFTVPAAMMPPPVHPPAIAPSALARLAPWKSLLRAAVPGAKLVGGSTRSVRPGEAGSNDWVVGPGRTTSGHALLANDPHLALTNPSIWFPVEIDAKSNGGKGSYHVAGGTFPGLPAVMIGQNESIAWGVTTAYYDLSDVYLEQLTTDNAKVHFNGSDVPLTTKDFDFQDAASGTKKTKTFQWVPHHGPLVSVDTTAHTGVSVRWRGHDGGTDLDAFYGIALATNVDDAKKALEAGTSANQNFVVIDGAGNIGWFPYSQVPSRPWASPAMPAYMPVPGDGTAEWGPPIPFASLPQLENPSWEAIATANNDMTGATADGDPTNDMQPALQAWGKADGTREQRILDLITAGGKAHTLDTLSAMQGDTYSLYGSIIAPALIAAGGTVTLTPDEKNVVDALAAWKLTCPTGLDGSDPVMSMKTADPKVASEAIGCTAFHATFIALVEQALGDEAAAAGITAPGFGLEFVARAIKDPATVASGAKFWDDVSTMGMVETETDILVRAIQRAAPVLAAIGPVDDWRWGKLHTLSLRSIYDSFGLKMYNYGPYAAPGGLFTVDVASPSSFALPMPAAAPDMSFKNGPSIRILVEATPAGPTMRFQLPGGEDLHRESPFYNNLLPNWLTNTPTDFLFGPDAVKMPMKTVVITPAP